MNDVAAEVIARAAAGGIRIATAESLTAGLVAASLAEVPGASAVLQGGIVAYQASVKQNLLGVDATLLAEAGTVDPRVAAAMARAVRTVLDADVGLATTGVAGPSAHGGRPVGTVFTAVSTARGTVVSEHHFTGDRGTIRADSRDAVLTDLLEELARGTNDLGG